MIIACPDCTSPFELADGQIAPLVQVECPTCSFRMILDFEAANDASLREDGMQMAQGFRSEVSYRQAVGAGQIGAATPGARAGFGRGAALRAVPAPEPAQPAPAVQPAAQMDAAPIVAPPVELQLDQQIVKPPVREQPALDKPPPEIGPGVELTAMPQRPRSRPTLIGHMPPSVPPHGDPPVPTVESAATLAGDVQAEPLAEAQIDTHIGPAPTEPDDEIELDQAAEPEPEPEPEAAVVERPPRPPAHTPAPEPMDTTTKPAEDKSKLAADPDAGSNPRPNRGESGSTAGTVIKLVILLILLAAAGLMTWSLITTQNPNPLPMLQEMMQGKAAGPSSGQVDGKAADGKTDDAQADAQADAK